MVILSKQVGITPLLAMEPLGQGAGNCSALSAGGDHFSSDTADVNKIVGGLNSSNAYIRRLCVIISGEHNATGRVAHLTKMLANDPSASVREETAKALGKMGDVGAFYPLVKSLEDPDALVRESGAEALGGFCNKEAVGPLKKLLSDKDPHVRASAERTLGSLDSLTEEDRLEKVMYDLVPGYIGQEYRAALRSAGAIGLERVEAYLLAKSASRDGEIRGFAVSALDNLKKREEHPARSKPECSWPYSLLNQGCKKTYLELTEEIFSRESLDRIIIQITSGCSSQCLMCFSSPSKKVTSMPFPVIVNLLKTAKSHGHGHVCLHHNNEPFDYYDPLSKKNLGDVIEKVYVTGLETNLITHAWNPANRFAQRSALKIADLPYSIGLEMSFHLYHFDVLVDAEKVIAKYAQRFINAIDILLVKKPRIRTFEHLGWLPEIAEAEAKCWSLIEDRLTAKNNGSELGREFPIGITFRSGNARKYLLPSAVDHGGRRRDLYLRDHSVTGRPYLFIFNPAGGIDLYIDDEVCLFEEKTLEHGKIYPIFVAESAK